MAQAGLARNKCGSGLASRCAARAALDFTGAESPKANTAEMPKANNPKNKAGRPFGLPASI